MVSLTQPLLAEEGEVEWQRHVDISPLRVSTPSGGGSGQGASAAQEPTDKAWAVAFKMNVVITIISVSYTCEFFPSPLPGACLLVNTDNFVEPRMIYQVVLSVVRKKSGRSTSYSLRSTFLDLSREFVVHIPHNGQIIGSPFTT